MPGLFGFVHRRPGPLEPERARRLLDAMGDRLRHVGGETVDAFFDPEGGVAVARIDRPGAARAAWRPPSARRPGWFLDGVVHDDPLGRGDATVDWRQRLRGLRGRFAACRVAPSARSGPDALGRADEPRLVLSVDRVGSRPLAWTVIDDVVYFAPEAKALLAVPGLDRTLDDGAFGMFFASGFLLADRTFFRAVHRLEGGRALVVEPTGDIDIETWADWSFTVDGDGTSDEALREELGRIVERAVARDLRGADDDPERAVVFLSGGKDSRMIAAAAARALGPSSSPLRTVSWTSDADGVEPAPGSDVHLARLVAERLGAEHRVLRRRLEPTGSTRDPANGEPTSFAQQGLRLTWILDGLVDIGMFHGDELRLMETLAHDGVERVLRGDQAFTRGRAMLDPAYAVLRMCIRSTSGLGGADDVWRDDAHGRACAGGDAWIDELVRSYEGGADRANPDRSNPDRSNPDNVGDAVYLRHRLQGYLGPAGYFKQLVVDHRNPLLDEDLLALVQRLSIASRREQRLLNEAGAQAFSEVWDLPFATTSNLERFADLLARPTPVRRAVRAALADERSGVWELFDRDALLRRLDGLRAGTAAGTAHGVRRRVTSLVKNVVRDAIYDIPALDVRVRGRYLRRTVRDDELFLRVVALKHFIDCFVDDDGSSAAFDRRRESLAAREADLERQGLGEPARA